MSGHLTQASQWTTLGIISVSNIGLFFNIANIFMEISVEISTRSVYGVLVVHITVSFLFACSCKAWFKKKIHELHLKSANFAIEQRFSLKSNLEYWFFFVTECDGVLIPPPRFGDPLKRSHRTLINMAMTYKPWKNTKCSRQREKASGAKPGRHQAQKASKNLAPVESHKQTLHSSSNELWQHWWNVVHQESLLEI